MLVPQTPKTFDAHDAIGYLIAANGNSKLAAVQAAKDHPSSFPTLTDNNASSSAVEAAFLAMIAKEPTALASLGQQITLLAYMSALDAFRVTHTAFMQKLPNLGPKDVAKAYTDLLDSLSKLRTMAPAQLPDPFETVMRRLPPEVAEAVEFFMRKQEGNAGHTAHTTPTLAPATPANNGASPSTPAVIETNEQAS